MTASADVRSRSPIEDQFGKLARQWEVLLDARYVPITTDDLRAASERITWFHTMDLGGGVRTHGVYDPTRTLPRLRLPERLDGRTVLDVGAWDGFYSFEMERRGADVLATDHFSWTGEGWGTKDGFLLARDALRSRVRDLDIDPTELTAEAVGGTYDIVLFLGVLYHLRDAMSVLDRLRNVTGDLLVLETEVGMLLTKRPAADFHPETGLNNDPTNWWAPNVPATVGMLRAAGFRDVCVTWKRSLPLRALKWGSRLVRPPRLSLREALTTDRFVFHARVVGSSQRSIASAR
ncbi:MAG: class I SAM-dependent methyltransferase [Frankiaceae bacterium]